MKSLRTLFLIAVLLLTISVAAYQAPGYHIATKYSLGGDGRVMVVDAASGNLLGEVPGLNRAHGVAFAYANNRGFATSGGDGTVTMFDLKTLKVLGKISAADDADAIFYDSVSKRVFTMNGDAHSSSVIDPATGKNVGTIALGGKPEFGVSGGDGMLYANITEKDDTHVSEVVEIDAKKLTITHRWPVAPCANSTGLAYDVEHHRLFSVCRNKYLAVSCTKSYKLITTVPIGAGVDAAAFDPATQLVFASNNDGTMTVVHEDTKDTYTVLETVPTGDGAKTMTLDPATHRVFLGAASFAPVDPSATGRRRPQMLPGSFKLLVLEKK